MKLTENTKVLMSNDSMMAIRNICIGDMVIFSIEIREDNTNKDSLISCFFFLISMQIFSLFLQININHEE